MLIEREQIRKDRTQRNKPKEPEASQPPVFRLHRPVYRNVSNPETTLRKEIGRILPGECVNFWSFGSYSLHELLFYLLGQTGPAHVNMCTWSISQDAIEKITRRCRAGDILSIRFLLDPHVKVCKAKPLQMLAGNFPYGITRIHAKVVTIENADWKISVVSSQNATSNPKLERGIIMADPAVFEFDKKVFDDEFERCTIGDGRRPGRVVLHTERDSDHSGSGSGSVLHTDRGRKWKHI